MRSLLYIALFLSLAAICQAQVEVIVIDHKTQEILDSISGLRPNIMQLKNLSDEEKTEEANVRKAKSYAEHLAALRKEVERLNAELEKHAADAGDAEELLAEANRLYEAEEWKEAWDKFAEAYSNDRSLTEAALKSAWCQYHLGMYEPALAQFEVTTEEKEFAVESLYGVALVSNKMMRLSKALEALSKLLDLEPNHIDGLVLSGQINYEMQLYEFACKKWTAAVEAGYSGDARFQDRLEIACERAKPASAKEVLEEAVDMLEKQESIGDYPNAVMTAIVNLVDSAFSLDKENELSNHQNFQAFRTKGFAEFHLGNRNRAKEALSAATKHNHEDLEVWQTLAKLEFDVGEFEAAAVSYEKCIALGGSGNEIRLALVKCYRETSNIDKCLQHLDILIANEFELANCYLWRAEIREKNSDKEAACKDLEAAFIVGLEGSEKNLAFKQRVCDATAELDELFEKGRKAYTKDKYEKAIEYFDQALATKEHCLSRLWRAMAYRRMASPDKEKFVEGIRKTLSCDVVDQIMLDIAARQLKIDKEYELAASAFVRLEELQPGYDYDYEAAFCYEKVGNLRKAIKHLELEIEKDFKHDASYPLLIDLYRRQEDYSFATDVGEFYKSKSEGRFSEEYVAKLFATKAKMFENVAWCYYKQGEKEAACEFYSIAQTGTGLNAGWKKILTEYCLPDDEAAENYFQKGKSAYEKKQYSFAAEFLRMALDLNPNHAPAWHYMGHVHRYGKPATAKTNGDLESALEAYTKAAELKPSEFYNSYYSAGSISYELGRYEKAAAFFKNAIRIKPVWADARYNLGLAYKNSGKCSLAISSFEKAESQYSENNTKWKLHCQYYIAICQIQEGKYKEGRTKMKNYLSNAQSEKWAAYVYLAYAAFKLDWKDLACLELEQAGNVANDYPKIKAEIDAHCKQYQGQHSFDYWFEKEKEADKKGNYELALFFGKKAVVLKPNHGQANLYLGDALYRSSTNKDIQKSIDHLKIAMNHVSGVELSRAYHGLAKAYHEQKKYDSSANYYKLAIENALKHPYPFDQNYKLQHFYSMRGLILVELYGKNDPEGCRCLKAAIKYEDQPSLRKYRVEDYQRYCPNVVSSTPATTTPSTTPSTSYTPSSSPCSDPNADHGYKKEYYDGYLYMEGEYECGKKTGEWKQYDLDGNLHYRWIFKNDEKVEFIRYFKGSSKIEAIWNPRDGAIWYDINGNVVDTDQY